MPKRLPKRLRDAGVTPELFGTLLLAQGVDPGSVGVDELKHTDAARTYRRLRRVRPRRLEDGTLGYFVRWPRGDDCQAAAVATVLQVPIGEVPDPRIDERLAAGEVVGEIDRSAQDQLGQWLARRGLRIVVHRKVPAARRRWIGVIALPGPFQNHCLVMDRSDFLFDPARLPDHALPGMGRLRRWGIRDISYGLSFQAI
jgi:hypothetical protein